MRHLRCPPFPAHHALDCVYPPYLTLRLPWLRHSFNQITSLILLRDPQRASISRKRSYQRLELEGTPTTIKWLLSATRFNFFENKNPRR
ncbi:hypothetical protein DMENIID0001_063770 [Sergentomyia squamirostris]